MPKRAELVNERLSRDGQGLSAASAAQDALHSSTKGVWTKNTCANGRQWHLRGEYDLKRHLPWRICAREERCFGHTIGFDEQIHTRLRVSQLQKGSQSYIVLAFTL